MPPKNFTEDKIFEMTQILLRIHQQKAKLSDERNHWKARRKKSQISGPIQLFH